MVRDFVGAELDKIRVDSRQSFDQLKRFTEEYVPELAGKLEYYSGESPIFDLYDVENEIQRALERKVELKSGGYLIIDQTEAMTLGDRIDIMKDGFIQQIGTPQEVFDQPANLFVAGFIGSPQMNFFDGELEKKDGKYQLKVGEATVVLGDKAQELLTGKGVGERKVTVGIRPEHIAFAAAPGSDTVSSKVDVSEMMGSEVYLHVNAVGRDVVLRIPTTDLPAEHRAGIPYGTEINFAFRPDLIHLFDPETEKNLMY